MLLKIWDAVNGKKSYIVAVVTLVYGVVQYGLVQNDWNSALDLVLSAAGLSAIRHAISNLPSTVQK